MEENINGKKPIKIVLEDEEEIGKKPIKILETKNIKNNKSKRKWFLLGSILIIIMLVSIFGFYTDIETVKDSVVMINVYDKYDNLISTGSGFCAFESNYIVTNFHVIEGGYKIKIITDDNSEFNIKDILVFNAADDLAILKGNFNLKPLRLAANKKIKVGEKITAIGSPKGELNTVSTGIISNSDGEYSLRITAPISPGSSGGVLLDSRNKVIGVTYATYNSEDAQNINYAISVKYLNELYNSLEGNQYILITNFNHDKYVDRYNIDQYYTVTNFELFYNMTSTRGRLENFILNNKWKSIYNNMSEVKKQKVVSLIEEIDNTEYDLEISSNIKNWNITEFFMNLKILKPYEYAIVTVDLENYSNKNKIVKRINSYNLGAAEKTLILYLIGEYSWEDISSDNKGDVFDFFDEKYNTRELGNILEVLGYDVVYKNNGLTAYW